MSSDFAARWESTFLGNYGTPALLLTHGSGAIVWDDQGRAYLDLLAGIAVSSLGHAHPALVAAVSGQVGKIAHTSNLYANEPALELAERLVEISGRSDGRVFLCNSGAEANEAALKLARRHAAVVSPDGSRNRFVACVDAFHGRTGLALSVTGQSEKRVPFEPLSGPVTFVPYGDAGALAEAVDETVAAVILEPTLGESGVVLPPDGYLAAARAVCDRAGSLLILDEVQGGIGRTGQWFAHRHPRLGPVNPDIITLAKGLGGGLPIGACLAFGTAASTFRKGDHGSTFGGNPVAAAAALAVIATIEAEDLLGNSTAMGQRLAAGLMAIEHPLVADVRGLGLWQALVLTQPVAGAVETAAMAAGFLVNAAKPSVVRLAPSLVITQSQVDSFVTALPGILETVSVGLLATARVGS